MMQTPSLEFKVSVVIVSDYEASTIKSWKVEERMLKAFAAQTFDESFEVLLVDNEQYQANVPDHLYGIVPNLRIVFSSEIQSARLKDYGVELASGELVAVLEADAPPCQNWLQTLVEILRLNPDVAVATGRTSYGTENTYKRVLNLLDRSFDDLGKPGTTPNISNNGAVYRRSVLKEFPYPDAATPFLSSRLRNKLIREAGHKFYFHPDAVTFHEIGGWGFIVDVRRNMGYSDMNTFSNKIGYSAIPGLMKRRLKKELSYCKRLGKQYLRWWDWPLFVTLAPIIPFLEVPGMLDAVQKKEEIPRTAYR
ncbi:glycosyltransferase family 2 protein [Leptothoe sp. PORK10 BA2]|uniref:glycosyltransferase family 2 protein n=1 Tax=Leptothoe sp. PORK10 BA2 TaxID=3110254 RepID=UPI002B1FE23A|nr:glycosyltransferase [Leptothoe sp. PORK10 BA2]MEA5466101.1 glycosyltransferase [Leptothoe sp. PORK10 BA2]